MRLLNSGTLNRGRNLWVTVAIDHLTVDGFHDELQPSAKKHQRRFDEWVESMFIWFVGMNITPFLFFFLLKFHQFGSTVLHRNTPRIRLVRGERKLERNSSGRRPWAVGHDGRIRILLRTAQLEGHDLAQIGDNSPKPKMDNQKLLEEFRFWEFQPRQGNSSQWNNDDKWSSQVKRTCVHPNLMCGRTWKMCTDNIVCTVSFVLLQVSFSR